jgi:hypothetical protein
MTLAKTIAVGATVLGLAAGSALAAEAMAQPETVILLEPVDIVTYDIYGVDENGDGLIDGYLVIEASDTLG